MARKRYKPEEIVSLLRQAEVLHGQGVVKLPPARRSGSVAGVTGACVCDGSGVKWPRVG